MSEKIKHIPGKIKGDNYGPQGPSTNQQVAEMSIPFKQGIRVTHETINHRNIKIPFVRRTVNDKRYKPVFSGRPTYANDLYHVGEVSDAHLIEVVFSDYSRPTPSATPENLRELKKSNYVVETDEATHHFDHRGRQIQTTEYNGRLSRNNAFAVERILTHKYDQLGFVTNSTVIKRGQIGFRRQIIYDDMHDENGNVIGRTPVRIITQNFLRQGVMEIGPDVGEPEVFELRQSKK